MCNITLLDDVNHLEGFPLTVRPPAAIIARLDAFRDLFTAPQFYHFMVFVWGVMLSSTGATLAKLNAVAGSGRHVCGLARFLSESPWSVELLSERLLRLVIRTCGPGGDRLIIALDDTDSPHPSAKKLFGLSRHFDADASKDMVVTRLGHCWLTMSLLVKTSTGQWLGFCFRAWLYIRQKDCPKGVPDKGIPDWPYRDKLELAAEAMRDFCWPHGIRRLVVADAFYAKADMANHDFDLLSRLTGANTFYESPPPRTGKRGRPQKYGRCWKLKDWAAQATFQACIIMRYGREESAMIAMVIGLRKGWNRPAKIIAIREEDGHVTFLVTTDLTMSSEEMVEFYAARFQIELGYRELKTDLGLADSLVRSRPAVIRYIHLMMVAQSLLKLAAIDLQKELRLPLAPSLGEVKTMLQRQQTAARIFTMLAHLGISTKNSTVQRWVRIAAG